MVAQIDEVVRVLRSMSGTDADDGWIVDLVEDVLTCRALDDGELMSNAVDMQRRYRCRLVELKLLML